ncbi:GDSL-type esterase/lipase family protein [Planococcus sp. FY231025]|uniref:GDSL-type esterase/lipase family protein n=1 Tax=Planococcus sp. FY231025 TaxID=3455699 RepID=UPI003F938582
MKKLLKMAAIILLAGSLTAPAAFAQSGNAKESLIALGDSIPFGYDLGQNNSHPAKTAYPYLIGEEADLRVLNLGIPGWQTDQLLSALQGDQKYRQAVQQADYVAVAIGSNDLLQALREAGVESGGDQDLFNLLLQQKLASSDVFSNLLSILTQTRALTDAPIVLYNVYNPFQLNNPLHYAADPILPLINGQFAQLASLVSGVTIADANAAFGNDQAIYVIPGDIHPTAAGQQVLSDNGIDALGLD